MKHYTYLGKFGVICWALLCLGCEKTQPAIVFPSEDLLLRESNPEAFLARIVIRPNTAKLSERELLELNAILLQTLSVAHSKGQEEVYLPVKTDLYRILEHSLSVEPKWHDAINNENDRVKLSRLVEFIETTQRKK